MRVKLLRGKEAADVLLVYPSTLREYWEAIEAIERRAAAGWAEPRSAAAAYVVTTSALRHRWGLPDMAASGPSAHGGRGGGVRTARRQGWPGRGPGRAARRRRGDNRRAAGHRDGPRAARDRAHARHGPRAPRPDARVAGGRGSPALRLRDAAR